MSATAPAQAIAITISVNGIQQQTFTLGDAPNFNVGIIDPIVLPGLANSFNVSFRFVSAQGQDLGDASKAVVLTQLVLDDGVVGVGSGGNCRCYPSPVCRLTFTT